jgi:hypothetical protein
MSLFNRSLSTSLHPFISNVICLDDLDTHHSEMLGYKSTISCISMLARLRADGRGGSSGASVRGTLGDNHSPRAVRVSGEVKVGVLLTAQHNKSWSDTEL